MGKVKSIVLDMCDMKTNGISDEMISKKYNMSLGVVNDLLKEEQYILPEDFDDVYDDYGDVLDYYDNQSHRID